MPNDYNHLYGRTAAPPHENRCDVPEGAPKPFTLDSAGMGVYAPPPSKPKRPFSPIPLLLIAGVVFLFLGGVIFLTSTWDVMPDAGRAVTLLSASVIAFGANLLAERVFKLHKTGLAFYILGCIFLPLSLGGIGVFALFGQWFSFAGDGNLLVCAVIGLSVGLSTFLGQHRYKSLILAWLSLSGFAGAWSFLSVFASEQILRTSETTSAVVSCCLWMMYAIGATVWTEWYLRKKQDTPIAKTALFVLYPLLMVYVSMMMSVLENAPLAETLLLLIAAVLFCNMRFAVGRIHIGVFGSMPSLMGAVSGIAALPAFEKSGTFDAALFVPVAVSMILMGFRLAKQKVLAHSYGYAGLLLGIPLALIAAGAAVFNVGGWLFFLFGLLVIGVVFFAVEKKNVLPKDAAYCCMSLVLVFLTGLLSVMETGRLLALLLILAALLMLAEAFISKRIWPLMTAIAACACLLIGRVPFPTEQETFAQNMILWLFAAGFLGTVVYAHSAGRGLLEKAAAWTALPFLLTVLPMTLDKWVSTSLPLWILTMAVVTMLYLLEAVVLWKHSRVDGTRPFLEIMSVIFSIAAVTDYLYNGEWGYGWGILLLLLLGTFAVVFTHKRINVVALPHLLMLFFSARYMLAGLDEIALMHAGFSHAAVWSVVFQIAGFALLLGILAVMGRFLLPDGFVTTKNGFRMDWPLLTGVLPVFGAAFTIDWHPAILVFLFLTLYSLLYIGRLQHRRIPALLASLFGCTTLFVHNAEDPFKLFALWHDWEVRTPQVLLYLLPLHLFIFLLLWILPEKCRPGVHVARFVMYCVTMLCLLMLSMSFGNVADAIILVVFSFGILAGSFSVKRLRWFTLGFAVLVVMTLRLTWSFWTSLHWGIYLFLAGTLLIIIASVYELKVRRAAENPDAPKKSMNPFSAWRW